MKFISKAFIALSLLFIAYQFGRIHDKEPDIEINYLDYTGAIQVRSNTDHRYKVDTIQLEELPNWIISVTE